MYFCNIHQNESFFGCLLIFFKDIFSNDVVKQKEITQLYSQLLKVREEILNSSTNNDAGQCINLQECDRLSVT